MYVCLLSPHHYLPTVSTFVHRLPSCYGVLVGWLFGWVEMLVQWCKVELVVTLAPIRLQWVMKGVRRAIKTVAISPVYHALVCLGLCLCLLLTNEQQTLTDCIALHYIDLVWCGCVVWCGVLCVAAGKFSMGRGQTCENCPGV